MMINEKIERALEDMGWWVEESTKDYISLISYNLEFLDTLDPLERFFNADVVSCWSKHISHSLTEYRLILKWRSDHAKETRQSCE